MEVHTYALTPKTHTLVFESGKKVELTPQESEELDRWLEEKLKGD